MSRMWNFHPVVENAVGAAGWSPAYSAPIDGWISRLQAEGYDVFDYARDVLASFGGLLVHPTEDVRAGFSSGPLRVGLVTNEFDRVMEWGSRLELPLVPVGEWMDYYFVVVAPDGRVFAGTLGQLLYLGSTFEEALELIVTATREPEEMTPG